MNRSKSSILIRRLPFSADEFNALKEQVANQVANKQKLRFSLQDEPQHTVARSFSMVPSMLHTSAATFNSGVRKTRKRGQSLVNPSFKVKVPVFSGSMFMRATESPMPAPNLMVLSRFRRVLRPTESTLCRQCYVSKAFKPKLFR